jgi:threonylcarbamoyladenosine tRNA methylthiotransferase MtaB
LPLVTPRRSAGTHVRCELKIQDGCDAHCSFCVIPKIRRTLRSKTIRDTVDEARRLVELGHLEIVLTGVFIGAYGHETALRRRQSRPGANALADLLDAVAQVPGLLRVRLSSMEPGDMTPALLEAIVANRPVVVPHLHLPLQSGSDSILQRMNRQYRLGDYLQMIEAVNEALTDGLPPAISTDIICGFPGETDKDFDKTIAVAQRVGFLHMHVFPFSPKRGTAAARWHGKFVHPTVTKARVRTLLAMESDPVDGLSIRFRRRLLGRTVRVILEQGDHGEDDSMMTGRCDHYALIHLKTRHRRGAAVSAEIIEVTPEQTRGRIVSMTVPLPVVQ